MDGAAERKPDPTTESAAGPSPFEIRVSDGILAVGSKSVPAAFAMFPRDLSSPPREWAERFFHVVRWTEFPRGGHFAAMEQPDLLAEDIRAFFRALR